MAAEFYEVRVCEACGLRYPSTEGNPFGARCPACMGATRVILRRPRVRESGVSLASGDTVPHLLASPKKTPAGSGTLSVLLDNIRSAWNVGSILRSADGFGFTHAYCCGITPTPENEAVTKTSLGAEDTVTWSHHKDAVRLAKGLKKEGWRVYALEEDDRSVRLGGLPSPRQPSVLIVGNEVTGVDPQLLDLCDAIYHIPMRGQKRSFNVAIAFGIAAYVLQ